MPSGLRERKKARMREQIVETTISLIRERGYDGATVEEITRRIEITTPTFYNYFAGKEAVLGHYYTEHVREWPALINKHRDSELSTLEKLQAMVSQMAEEILADAELWRAVILYGDVNPAVNATQREAEREAEGSLNAIFVDGQQRGELRTDLPADLLQAVYDGACHAITYGWAAGEVEDNDLEPAYLAALEVCVHGMNVKG